MTYVMGLRHNPNILYTLSENTRLPGVPSAAPEMSLPLYHSNTQVQFRPQFRVSPPPSNSEERSSQKIQHPYLHTGNDTQNHITYTSTHPQSRILLLFSFKYAKYSTDAPCHAMPYQFPTICIYWGPTPLLLPSSSPLPFPSLHSVLIRISKCMDLQTEVRHTTCNSRHHSESNHSPMRRRR